VSDHLLALRYSVERLRAIVESLGPGRLEEPAYPADWSIGDVLSHVGSGAVILDRHFEDAVEGRNTDESFNESVWAEWNAKEPASQAADALVADASLLEHLSSLDDTRRGGFHFSMGPINLDFDGLAGLRLNEHALHTWDIEVAVDPTATLPLRIADAVVDNLDMIAGFSARPTGDVVTIALHTVDPERDFTISLDTNTVMFSPSDPVDEPDLELPAEALIRLIYGRLDPSHSSGVSEGRLVDILRRAFPGV